MPKPEHISGQTVSRVRSKISRSTGPCDFQRRGCNRPEAAAGEIKRARRKPTENLDAYDYYLRGLSKVRVDQGREQRGAPAFLQGDRARPSSGLRLWHGRICYVRRKARGWTIERVQEGAEATRLARKAVQLGADDPMALCTGAYALAFVAHEFDDAAAFMDRGLAVNPNLARAWMFSGWLRVWRGEPDLTLEHVAHAVRLSPLDPSMYGMLARLIRQRAPERLASVV